MPSSKDDDFYPNLFIALENASSSGWFNARQRDTLFLAVKNYRPATPRPLAGETDDPATPSNVAPIEDIGQKSDDLDVRSAPGHQPVPAGSPD